MFDVPMLIYGVIVLANGEFYLWRNCRVQGQVARMIGTALLMPAIITVVVATIAFAMTPPLENQVLPNDEPDWVPWAWAGNVSAWGRIAFSMSWVEYISVPAAIGFVIGMSIAYGEAPPTEEEADEEEESEPEPSANGELQAKSDKSSKDS